jgi:hypothetical protein
MNRKYLLFFLTLMLSFSKAFGQGCSQCKMLAEQGSTADEATFGTNINYGILYLMVIPYLMLMFLFRKQIIRFLKSTFKASVK